MRVIMSTAQVRAGASRSRQNRNRPRSIVGVNHAGEIEFYLEK